MTAGSTLLLDYEAPLAWAELLGFLGGRGAAGVESVHDGGYRRTVAIGAARGWLEVVPAPTRLNRAALQLRLSSGLEACADELIARLRRLLDLEAKPALIAAHLACDARLAPVVRQTPGLRVPGAFDSFELVLRAILGQQVTVKAATTLFGRFAAKFGEAIETPHADLRYLSPPAERIADAGLQTLIDLGLTQRRAQTIKAVAGAHADGSLRLEAGAAQDEMLARFLALPGIGDWTANYVAMRALRMADAFPHGDLALCKALGGVRPREALAMSEAWRPWRAYAALYLWHGLKTGGGG